MNCDVGDVTKTYVRNRFVVFSFPGRNHSVSVVNFEILNGNIGRVRYDWIVHIWNLYVGTKF